MLRACLHHATLHFSAARFTVMKTVYFTSRSSYSGVRHQSAVWDGRSLKAAVYLKMPSITDSQGTRDSLECRGCVKVVCMFQGHTVHVTMF